MQPSKMGLTRRLVIASPFAVAFVLNLLSLATYRLRWNPEHVARYGFLFAIPWAWSLDGLFVAPTSGHARLRERPQCRARGARSSRACRAGEQDGRTHGTTQSGRRAVRELAVRHQRARRHHLREPRTVRGKYEGLRDGRAGGSGRHRVRSSSDSDPRSTGRPLSRTRVYATRRALVPQLANGPPHGLSLPLRSVFHHRC